VQQSENEKTFLTKLQEIDPKWIYLVQLLVISLPLLFPMGLPLGTISKETKGLYDALDDLPPGSIVFHAVNMGPAAAAECQPGLEAIVEHNLRKDLRMVFYTNGAPGIPFIEQAMKKILGASYDHTDYGKLYVNIGYIPQQYTGFSAFCNDLFFTGSDAYGNDLRTMEFFDDLPTKTAADFDFGLTYGSTNFQWIITYLSDPWQVPCGGGIAAGIAAEAYPFYPEKTPGFLVGLRGGAEYEVIIDKPGYAAAGMDAQSMAHLAIIIMVLIGNAAYFASKLRGEEVPR
jgi:hypothetical protein